MRTFLKLNIFPAVYVACGLLAGERPSLWEVGAAYAACLAVSYFILYKLSDQAGTTSA